MIFRWSLSLTWLLSSCVFALPRSLHWHLHIDTGQYEPRFLDFQEALFFLNAVTSASSSWNKGRMTVFQLPEFTPREADAEGRDTDTGFCRFSAFLVSCWGMAGRERQRTLSEGPLASSCVLIHLCPLEAEQRSQAESPPLTALQIPPHPHLVVKSLSEAQGQ